MPGGGGGSIHAMITSLRENKKLLRKKTFFLREDIAELHRAEHHEPLQFKEANKEVLQQIKQKHGLRKRLTGLLAFAIVLLTAGISLYFVFVNQPKQPKISNSQKAEKLVLFNQKIVKKEKQYLFYVQQGDAWYTQGHFKNAVFQYNAALKLYPNSEVVKTRLQTTYALACERVGIYCNEANDGKLK